MYKKILAPLDGSEFSECILGHVKAVATGCNVSEVILLRVTEPVRYEAADTWGPGAAKKTDAAAMEYLSQMAALLKQEGIAAKTVVVRGQAAEEILDYIKNNQVDLVIMSTHGRSGISRWFFGSVAEWVVRRSVAPVLLVPLTACILLRKI